MPASSRSREARPGLSGSVRSLQQEPWWSAERRACSDERASAPAHIPDGNIRCAARSRYDAPSGALPPFFIRRRICELCSLAWWLAKPGRARVAGANYFVRPRAVKRSGGGGPPKAVEGARGLAGQTGSAVRGAAPPTTPGPPSPLSRGGMKAARREKGYWMTKRRKKSGRRGLYNKRLTPDEQAAQREAAFAAIRRLYAEALPLWRSCPRGYCRRHKACSGEASTCLKRGWPLMPAELQRLAFDQVMAGGPRRLPPATHTEWHLRRFPPSNFVL